jgi:hypothetical protein
VTLPCSQPGGTWRLLAPLLLLAAGCARVTAPPEEQPPGLFRDVTAESGVRFTYRSGEENTQHALLEMLGGGVAVLDYDGDGLLDLFIVGGGYFDGPDKHQIKGHTCRLYKNLGGFRFKDVTAEVGLDKLAGGKPWFYSHGVAVADYDRDGWPDLLVTGWGAVALLHNVPVDPANPRAGRRFVDGTKSAGLDKGITWATGAAFGDLDGDGYPDLYLCQYVNWSWSNHPACMRDEKTRDVCTPRNFQGLENKLFRNNGDGTFSDVSKSSGLRVARTPGEDEQLTWLTPEGRRRLRESVTKSDGKCGKALGVLFIDVLGTGRPSIYVANDLTENFLYVNRTTKPGAIHLEECGASSGTNLSEQGLVNAGMGVDAADYDGSGRPSLWVTNYADQLHALYHNESQGKEALFTHVSTVSGIASAGMGTVGWGTGFLDIEHRGWEDLFLTAGDAQRYTPTWPRAQKPMLFGNRGQGRFEEATARGGEYFRRPHEGRGVVLADLDNDGRIDLVISHLNEPITLLRNEADTTGNHWLGVELVGAAARESGGRRQMRFAKAGGSYLSSSDRRHVFGLGKSGKIDLLRVIWPSGKEQQWRGLDVDRYWRLTEEQQTPQPLQPGPPCHPAVATP